ncbi:PREDICTED: uncharacterized protein LOC104593040 [Nelumbo nucifera]|uniref:Uncharacterized protein LOC104593040 n=2 Tax=Nelumbo nucifera TaxID=4432 RepID=A0A1U7ZDV2_NELNU|nr:PREDICTED: uncharacterized protein LOC104593040 [Nelumbo nucifera]DAD34408.1 TPA_asm: hypothetical protein HUJ06_005048 [Nelumbo nucifera]
MPPLSCGYWQSKKEQVNQITRTREDKRGPTHLSSINCKLHLVWVLLEFLGNHPTMSAIEMASPIRLSYQRFRNEGGFDVEEERDERAFRRTRSWFRFRKLGNKKRSRIRIPGLRRFLRRRARLLTAARLSWNKVVKRLKESRGHMGDLFSGNYLFLQVSPSPLKCSYRPLTGHHLYGLSSSSRYSLGKIA